MLSVHMDVRGLHGGSQPHLMQASDGHLYVVKFRNNPQGIRVLINELLASRIAEIIGLPVPKVEVIRIDDGLTRSLKIELAGGSVPVEAGLHCASRLVVDPVKGRFYDFLPAGELTRIVNKQDFIGTALFDFWTCNCDVRQVVFWRLCRERNFKFSLIDNGFCFGGTEWKLSHGVMPKAPGAFGEFVNAKRWIDQIRRVTREQMELVCREVPEEWCPDRWQLEAMLDRLAWRQAEMLDVLKLAWGVPDQWWTESSEDGSILRLSQTNRSSLTAGAFAEMAGSVVWRSC